MKQSQRRLTTGIGIGAMVLLLTGMVAHQALPHRHGASVEVPAESEFGLGPRVSAGGLYSATLDPRRPIQVGKMQSVAVVLMDSAGLPVSEARFTVDGGMPQHGHGLPTNPQVGSSSGEGTYEIQGVKFNMGGWWVFRLHVEAAAGTDSITFNLAL